MSSCGDTCEPDNRPTSAHSSTKAVQRACDMCKLKKVKCEDGQVPGRKCANCLAYNYECTYVEAKKRGPPKGYVERLENRLQKTEALLRKLYPSIDLSQELDDPLVNDNEIPDPRRASSSFQLPSVLPPPTPDPDSDNFEPSDDESADQSTLVDNMKKMEIDPSHTRWFGKSSSALFIQTARHAKQEYANDKQSRNTSINIQPKRRPFSWGIDPWILPTIRLEHPHHVFPPDDLLFHLVDLYFDNVNDYYPLLHRATFLNSLHKNLHRVDIGFGSLVLLACAVASRFTNDPRVLLEGSGSMHSSGWKYFSQVHMMRRSLLTPPRLYDLQMCFLMCIYLEGTSVPQACWTAIGVGIRFAQDVGAHRRKMYSKAPSVEDELWKRVVWCLVSMDRRISIALGRPCAMWDEDFDLELPVECDDEYWVETATGLKFEQPPGKPSKISFFNCFQRLNQILAFALRTIYSTRKSRTILGFVGQQWEQKIVAELDSSLNKWLDSVPAHLRWDPNQKDILLLNQSAFLYSQYYQLQMVVHRPFIPLPGKRSSLFSPSLAICTNAARSCIRILYVAFQHSKKALAFHEVQVPLFTSAVIMLLNIWEAKRSGASMDVCKEMVYIHKSMRMLSHFEPRWYLSGRLLEMLYELACAGDIPLQQPSPFFDQTRCHEDDKPLSEQSSMYTPPSNGSPSPFAVSNHPNPSAGYTPQYTPGQQDNQTPTQSYTLPNSRPAITGPALPLYTDESVPIATNDWLADSQLPPMQGPSTHDIAFLTANLGTYPDLSSTFPLNPSVYDQMMSTLTSSTLAPQPPGYFGGMSPANLAVGGMAMAPPYEDTETSQFTEPASDFPAIPPEWQPEDWGSIMFNLTGMKYPDDSPN